MARDAGKLGIPPSRLSYYEKMDLIKRIARGVYQGVDVKIDIDFQWEDLILTAKSVHNGVICLVSALSIYDLTEEITRAYWIAIPHGTTAPKRLKARFVRMRDISTGKQSINFAGETIVIFNRERTIVDAFRYLAPEIAIKALRKAIKQKIDMRKLQRYAKKFRVNIDPYIIAVTTI